MAFGRWSSHRALIAAAVLELAASSFAQGAHPSAASMQDVQRRFAGCFPAPPHEAYGARLIFYFSLKSDGREFEQLRTVWFGFKGSSQARHDLTAALEQSFRGCLPLPLDDELARKIPGKVYYLQYAVAADGQVSTLLRPYGSHVPPDDWFRRY